MERRRERELVMWLMCLCYGYQVGRMCVIVRQAWTN